MNGVMTVRRLTPLQLECERLQGMPNAEIKYDKLNDKISFYTKRGYVVYFNDFNTTQKYDVDYISDQKLYVKFKHTYTKVDKNTYEKDKCLNKSCTVKQPEKGC